MTLQNKAIECRYFSPTIPLLPFPTTSRYYFSLPPFPATVTNAPHFHISPPLSKKAAVLVRPTCFMYADKLIPKDYTKGGAM